MRALLLGVFFCMPAAHASWLHLCPATEPTPAPLEARVMQAGGGVLRAFVSDMPIAAGCSSLALSPPVDEIVALKPISPELARSLGKNPVLQGVEESGRFRISEVIGSVQPPAPSTAPMPLAINQLAALHATTFGVEERVQQRRDDGRLTLQCAAGAKPAGVILRAPWYLPRARLGLHISASGRGRFEITAADAALAMRESPLVLGRFDAGAMPGTKRFPLPDNGFTRRDWAFWAIACPMEAGTLRIDALQIVPQPTAVPSRATWVWNASAWREAPDTVLAHARKYAIGTLFVTVPLNAGEVQAADQLAAFIRRAAAVGIGVWAVDGDPNMVRVGERAAAAARARAYAAYNRNAPADARLKGIQFDVEPYLLPGYDLAVGEWERRYVELVAALHENADNLPLEMVVPFWWAGKAELLHAIAPLVDGLTVMDYRTDADEIYRFATPFLDWSDAYGKRVRIALEAGPIGAEIQRRYSIAASGDLWQVSLGKLDFLLMLKQPRANPHGPSFLLSGTSVVSGAGTSFHSDPARLIRMLPALEAGFAAWPGFTGIALHELK